VRVSRHAHDGVVHIHAHASAPQAGAVLHYHQHQHADRSHLRAALVGTVHGMAGSAALVVLTSATAGSFWMGFAYIASFGMGSMIGMAALSLAISVPLELSSRRLGHAHGLVEVPIACGTMVLGFWMLR
jgi:sulfite exporter TauE/SafE